MAAAGRRRLGWAALIFVLWLGLLAGAYWFFLVKPQQWFDPAMQQPPELAVAANQQALRQWLQRQFPELNPGKAWFIRFRQQRCGCERFVELYHQTFATQADPQRMQVVTVTLDGAALNHEQQRLLQRLIPATPSVVLFDDRGEVAYFGPYHQEGVCNADNSYLEPVLAALQQGRRLSVLNTLVFGCFCPSADSTD
ncbi:MAG: DUF6436 domain-containing protein [Pseudomonadota bacterium]|nr:DUF6436 domain-containing protein [Pseudomonadota bacterium]